MTRQIITHINPLDMALLLLLFEGSTLFVMGTIFALIGAINSVLLGILVGVFGTLIALGMWHLFRFRVRTILAGKLFELRGINVLHASIANALFLVALFLIENLVGVLRNIPFAGTALLGFFAVGLTIALLLLLYNLLPFKFTITTTKNLQVARCSALKIAIAAGIYEAIILPLMYFFLQMPLPILLRFTITGILMGFFGGLAGTWIFNVIAPALKPWVELQTA